MDLFKMWTPNRDSTGRCSDTAYSKGLLMYDETQPWTNKWFLRFPLCFLVIIRFSELQNDGNNLILLLCCQNNIIYGLYFKVTRTICYGTVPYKINLEKEVEKET